MTTIIIPQLEKDDVDWFNEMVRLRELSYQSFIAVESSVHSPFWICTMQRDFFEAMGFIE